MRRIASIADVIAQEIIPALGEYAADYDVDAIARETFEWKIDTNDAGQELLNTGGFEQIVDEAEFWEIVARHDRTA